MYLEERVARVEAFMELFLSEHPDMCPHQWMVEGGSYLDEKGNHKVQIQCRFCGKQEERTEVKVKTDSSIGFSFSF